MVTVYASCWDFEHILVCLEETSQVGSYRAMTQLQGSYRAMSHVGRPSVACLAGESRQSHECYSQPACNARSKTCIVSRRCPAEAQEQLSKVDTGMVVVDSDRVVVDTGMVVVDTGMVVVDSGMVVVDISMTSACKQTFGEFRHIVVDTSMTVVGTSMTVVHTV